MTCLIGFVKKQTEIRKDHPEFLPAVAVLKFAQQIAAELIDEGVVVVQRAHTCVPMPADVHGGVGAVLLLGRRKAVTLNQMRLLSRLGGFDVFVQVGSR